MQFDISSHIGREAFIRQLNDDVEAESIARFDEGHRNHLGASIIGRECWRYSWNVFRWIRKEKFTGRMLRLFNRGHLEEARFVAILRNLGFEISEVDPISGKQYRIAASGGHFGGSTDGLGGFPARYGINYPLVFEMKTHSEKSFTKLKKDGVKKAKPEHVRQMSIYGKGFDIYYGLYCAVNKNTDELWFELVELDFNDAAYLYDKADKIILSQVPPPKIANSPAFFDCKWCAFASNCHAQAMPEKNCRSCLMAVPVDGAQWYCKKWQGVIPTETIKIGCGDWGSII